MTTLTTKQFKVAGIALVLACLTPVAYADAGKLNAVTEHQLIHMTRHRVYNPYAPTGEVPYIGRIGIEYTKDRLTYSLSYIHRSNADIGGNEYNYDGVAVGIKYTHCLLGC